MGLLNSSLFFDRFAIVWKNLFPLIHHTIVLPFQASAPTGGTYRGLLIYQSVIICVLYVL